jgi:glycosyltransferase involved in cell wall biosynthesis
MQSILTVAIPTFNRIDAAQKTLKSLSPIFNQPQVKILVIDNGSTDGTYPTLQESFPSVHNLESLRFEDNLGFFESFLRLFENANSDYLLLLSDEDEVNLVELPALLRYLQIKKPGYISSQFFKDGQLYRGNHLTQSISLLDLEKSSFYISGLVFNVSKSQKITLKMRDGLKANPFILLYPQTYLALMLKISDGGYWLESILASKRDNLPTSVVDARQESYTSKSSRISQHFGWEEMVKKIISDERDKLSRRDIFVIKCFTRLRENSLRVDFTGIPDGTFLRSNFSSRMFTCIMSAGLLIPRKIFWRLYRLLRQIKITIFCFRR